MYYHFSKVAQLLIYPLNIALIMLVVTYYCQRRGRLVAARRLIIANLAFLWILSLPIVANAMMLKLESTYPVKTLLSYPKADAIVVLGGSVGPVLKPRLEAEESGGARVTYAARLFKAGKAPFVLVTGGGSYQGSDQQLRTDRPTCEMCCGSRACRKSNACWNANHAPRKRMHAIRQNY